MTIRAETEEIDNFKDADRMNEEKDDEPAPLTIPRRMPKREPFPEKFPENQNNKERCECAEEASHRASTERSKDRTLREDIVVHMPAVYPHTKFCEVQT